MPGAPRFTQKPSIQQTSQGDLLMECHLEADPLPEVCWHHSGVSISASSRVQLSLNPLSGNLYKAILIIKVNNNFFLNNIYALLLNKFFIFFGYSEKQI